jgi:hypothetical protein
VPSGEQEDAIVDQILAGIPFELPETMVRSIWKS